jgi:CheY-like chemotaxis protein
VRGHKGGIKVYSEPGRGTTIKLLFPSIPDALREEIHEEPDGDGKWQGKGTVLLVDDDETVRAVGRQMLERLGFKVLTANDGSQGVASYREHTAEIDCVLLDLTMPHMDGEETFREMRRIHSGVRVILSSGYNEQDVIQRFAGKGLAGFIQKPYTLEPLRAAIQKAFVNTSRPED